MRTNALRKSLFNDLLFVYQERLSTKCDIPNFTVFKFISGIWKLQNGIKV